MGDLDILLAGQLSKNVVWYEEPEAVGRPRRCSSHCSNPTMPAARSQGVSPLPPERSREEPWYTMGVRFVKPACGLYDSLTLIPAGW